MKSLLSAGKVIAVQLFFGLTFFLAAILKWKTGVTPDFQQQFGETFLASLPGGLPAVFYFIALIETIAFLGLLVSFLSGEFLAHRTKPLLKLSLVFCLFIFVILAFGSRLTGKFEIAATNMLYFVGALVSLREVSREES